ncbi:Oxidoreductase family protein [Elusimicrobium minutum Pei191]|uniref:Oxidoreductase family protein n=1 Tax=Elusimicrobium minutum (strain Pei191) TaxID=445932 RepID=B2KEW1_ELUMP|nr:Gfo/Idh/MocA family oxidoreductase [Elusimicrobium minutum]ACC99057.1 Oxidoreductase family protein [Elusimicrobium minutum Pei191]
MADNIKIGVIGAGKIGTFHTRTLAKMEGMELVGVCDPDALRAQKLAWEYNCTPYTKYEDLVPLVDAVVVAAPTPLHHEVGMYCLRQGVHTMMEKPIASNMEQAKELIALAKERKVVLQVGHVERFNPAVVEAMKYIKNPKFITINRLGPYDPRMAAVGVVLDLMIHDIDLLLTMIDSKIINIEATGLSVFSSQEDIANVRFTFENGCIADVTASRASFERARYMHLFQEDAYISVDFMNAAVKMYKKEKPVITDLKDITVFYPQVNKQMPITSELLHFKDCILSAGTPAPSGERASMALEIAMQIEEKINRYDLPKAATTGPAMAPKPLKDIVDVARAAKIIVDETLGSIRGKGE